VKYACVAYPCSVNCISQPNTYDLFTSDDGIADELNSNIGLTLISSASVVKFSQV
jgi:hypothetical protein